MDSDWISSRRARGLLWAALLLSLALGSALIIVGRHEADVAHRQFASITDEQAARQVVDAAKRIVAVAHLQEASGGYTFVSCAGENEPPYQAALYMSFSLPHSDWDRYLDDVASAMIADGWSDAPAKAEHFGRKLAGVGVTAVLQRNVDDPAFATMRLYGECRNTTDHRNDNPAWTEVSL
ncbi:hypothetical protein ACIA48_12410 [Mycobacterium sp. NPDC051804]|uniref:hypothetical protein n=1 Tax=Mycobacterium sp. NPDC051804 TaxID=3364295 RepID=UPI0037B81FC2